MSYASARIRIYLNTGTDSAPLFDSYVNLQVNGSDYGAPGGYQSMPEIVDWNNDGKLDVLCGGYAGTVDLMINTGTAAAPAFSARQAIQNGASDLNAGYRSSPAVADWNRDGKKDLLVGSSDGQVRYYENTGTDSAPVFNGYSLVRAAGTTIDVGSYSRLDTADLNGDGLEDLLVGAYDGRIRFFEAKSMVIVSVPASATEGDGVLVAQGSVTVSPASATSITVGLASDDTSEATVPATVIIAAGATQATFDVTITDDAVLDGSQSCAITATATGLGTAGDSIVIHDNETATLSVHLPTAATEGDGVLREQGTVSVNVTPDADVVVMLASRDLTEVAVPNQVVVTAGSTAATFDITVVEDSVIDYDQRVDVVAHVDNWTDGSDCMTIRDNEHTNLMVVLPDWTGEGDGVLTGAGLILLSGTVTSAVLVSLESLDLTELTVPSSVTVPAGASSALFDLAVINDSDHDGQQTAGVSATAPGFLPGTATVPVADNEIHHIEFGLVPSPQAVAVPFPVTVRMCDITGSNAAFAGKVAFSGAGDSGGVTLAPLASGPLTRGVWAGLIQVDTLDTAVRLAARYNRLEGRSQPFDVVPGPVDHFSFSALVSPQTASIPFGVSIVAQDANNYTVTDFSGSVALAVSAATQLGTDTNTWEYPLRTYYEDARVQVIYPAGDIGKSGIITSLALDVTALPGQTARNWTIRLKHTTRTGYSTAPAWEGDGWTTVYQSDQTFTSTGWTTFEFETPFTYNGTDSLMVDFSFNNTSWSRDGRCRCTTGTETRALYSCTDSAYGDPLAWSGTAGPTPASGLNVPNIRLAMGDIRVTPDTSGAFVDGMWSGNVTLLDGGTNIRLHAFWGGAEGYSDPLDVVDPSINVQCNILGSTDDGQETVGRQVTTTGGDTLEPGSATHVVTGLRFADVPVPAGAVIRSAAVQFTAAAVSADTVEVIVCGQKSPDAATFVNGQTYNMTARPRTDNRVTWTPPPWTEVDDAGAAQRTPDLTDILQEIVSQPGWASNQAVCLLFVHDSNPGMRIAHAFDGDPSKAAVLQFSYWNGNIDQDNDGMPDAWEIEHFGSTTNSSGQLCDDFDGDGMCDKGEYYCGTDPTLSSSVLAVTHVHPISGQDLVVRWSSATGRTYAIDRATGPVNGFLLLTNGLPATPPENAYTITVDRARGPVFYRVRLE